MQPILDTFHLLHLAQTPATLTPSATPFHSSSAPLFARLLPDALHLLRADTAFTADPSTAVIAGASHPPSQSLLSLALASPTTTAHLTSTHLTLHLPDISGLTLSITLAIRHVPPTPFLSALHTDLLLACAGLTATLATDPTPSATNRSPPPAHIVQALYLPPSSSTVANLSEHPPFRRAVAAPFPSIAPRALATAALAARVRADVHARRRARTPATRPRPSTTTARHPIRLFEESPDAVVIEDASVHSVKRARHDDKHVARALFPSQIATVPKEKSINPSDHSLPRDMFSSQQQPTSTSVILHPTTSPSTPANRKPVSKSMDMVDKGAKSAASATQDEGRKDASENVRGKSPELVAPPRHAPLLPRGKQLAPAPRSLFDATPDTIAKPAPRQRISGLVEDGSAHNSTDAVARALFDGAKTSDMVTDDCSELQQGKPVVLPGTLGADALAQLPGVEPRRNDVENAGGVDRSESKEDDNGKQPRREMAIPQEKANSASGSAHTAGRGPGDVGSPKRKKKRKVRRLV